MSESLALWISAAVLLFWSVGAYNRLVRLRAAVLLAFAAVEVPLREQVELAQSCLPLSANSAGMQEDVLQDDMSSLWSGLGAAANQFAASLAGARAHPLDPDTTAALNAAIGVMQMAWQRMQQDDAHDLAGAALPENLQLQWQQLEARREASTALFNEAINQYNGAIAQFPALLLASLFHFKPARTL